MKRIVKDRKFLMGLAVSLVLAMAVGSFALGENQTPVTPQVQTRSLAATNDGDTGAFDVEGGTAGTDYDYANGVLSIHPQSSDTSFEIKNKDPGTETQDRIEITAGPNDAEKAVNITLNGVNINTYDGQALTDMGAAFKIAENAEFNVNITLADNSKNYLTSDNPHAGLEKSDDKTTEADIAKLGTLTIGVPSDSTLKNGMLEATTGAVGDGGAGIGGRAGRSTSNIHITGGVIKAKGKQGGAGIGSGKSGGGVSVDGMGGRYIYVSSGTVEALSEDSYGEMDGCGAGIGGGRCGNGTHIYITGGNVTAKGSSALYGFDGAAGIGGGSTYGGEEGGEGSDINISGGEVNSTGGLGGAGIGGGMQAKGTGITISGGVVTATGGEAGAGIGGGGQANGEKIEITGGVIKATGGLYRTYPAAGIGGGGMGGASDNKLDGDAVVMAASGGDGKDALEGFVDSQGGSLITRGIVFTGVVTAFDTDGKATEINWDESGMDYCDSFTISQNIKFPANFTIGSGKELTVETGVTLTLPAGVTLKNEGTLTINGDVDLSQGGTITTKTNLYLTDGTKYGDEDYYQTYQTSEGVQKYKDLPNPDDPGPANEAGFIGWYYLDKDGNIVMIDNTKEVLLNQHDFDEYRANVYKIEVGDLENGQIKLDAEEVVEGLAGGFEVIPDEGYQLKEGSLKVTANGKEVEVKEKDGKYTFKMPGGDVTITATFELIPEPTPTPPTPTPPGPEPTPTPPGPEPEPTPEPTPDPSVDPDGDDSGASSKTSDPFMGGVALALLGVATTGAILTRKLR